jgi:hypothetical protein
MPAVAAPSRPRPVSLISDDDDDAPARMLGGAPPLAEYAAPSSALPLGTRTKRATVCV